MTFTVGPARPRPRKVRPRPGPQPAKLLLTSPGPARACKFQARTRPGPQNIIESWPGPVHGLRAGPARGPRPGPCRTLAHTMRFSLVRRSSSVETTDDDRRMTRSHHATAVGRPVTPRDGCRLHTRRPTTVEADSEPGGYSTFC